MWLEKNLEVWCMWGIRIVSIYMMGLLISKLRLLCFIGVLKCEDIFI